MAAALRCEIFPADLDATVAFYVSVLGFELVRDERDQPSAYVALARDTVLVGAAIRRTAINTTGIAAASPSSEHVYGKGGWSLQKECVS